MILLYQYNSILLCQILSIEFCYVKILSNVKLFFVYKFYILNQLKKEKNQYYNYYLKY